MPLADPGHPSAPVGLAVPPLVTGLAAGAVPEPVPSMVAEGHPFLLPLDGRLAAAAASAATGSDARTMLLADSAAAATLMGVMASPEHAFAEIMVHPSGAGSPLSVPEGSLVGLPVSAPPPRFASGASPPSASTRSRRRAARAVTRSARSGGERSSA